MSQQQTKPYTETSNTYILYTFLKQIKYLFSDVHDLGVRPSESLKKYFVQKTPHSVDLKLNTNVNILNSSNTNLYYNVLSLSSFYKIIIYQ